MTPSNQGKDKDKDKIPGYIEGALLNILEYDRVMLSEYGEAIAKAFKQIRDKEDEELRIQAEQLDDLFK